MYLYHLISIDLQSSRSFNTHTGKLTGCLLRWLVDCLSRWIVLATEVAFCRGATCSVRHQYQPNIGLLHHPPGTPVRGQFLMYIRALRATLNQADRSFNSVSLSIS